MADDGLSEAWEKAAKDITKGRNEGALQTLRAIDPQARNPRRHDWSVKQRGTSPKPTTQNLITESHVLEKRAREPKRQENKFTLQQTPQ